MLTESTFPQGSPYVEVALYYDRLYAAWGKDYVAESARIHELIQQHKLSDGNDVLDVGCGTAEHLRHLQVHYEVTGLDTTEEMLALARTKLPGVMFTCQDMVDFQLDSRSDVILSLFSAISYVQTLPRLKRVVAAMSRHLKPGGVIIIKPWYSPDEFEAHRRDTWYGELDGFRACRMRESVVEGTIARITGHIMISGGEGVHYFRSRHDFGLFTKDDLRSAFTDAGLRHVYVEGDLTGIGLHIGVKPCEDCNSE